MKTIPQYVCAVIPPHMLARVAERTTGGAAQDARATIDHMREPPLAAKRMAEADVGAAGGDDADGGRERRVQGRQGPVDINHSTGGARGARSTTERMKKEKHHE